MREPRMSKFNRDVMFSSASEEWETPQDVFDYCNEHEGPLTLDVCTTHENAKCLSYITKEQDGLKQNWGGKWCWMNPPYGNSIKHWVKKAYTSSLKPGTKVVCLLPARTDTKWFHDYCTKGRIWFIRGRLKFGGAQNSAPFPSMIVIFHFNGGQMDGDAE